MATATTPPPPREEERVTRPPEPIYQWFTTCPQGWLTLVVRGEDLRRVIHSVRGWYVDQNFHFQEGVHTVSPLRASTGREFVGIPGWQGLHTYKFAWTKNWRKKKEGSNDDAPEYEPIAHDPERVYLTPFVAQYPLVYGGIDVIDADRTDNDREVMVPVTLTITVRVRMRRPEVALMDNTDWFGQVLTPQIRKATQGFAGDKAYDWMIRNAREEGSREFSAQFINTDGRLNTFSQDILREGGVEIISIGITDIQANKVFQDALDQEAAAERLARAAIAKAKGEAEARKLAGEAEEAYQAAVGRGNAARIMAEAQADMERILKTIIQVTGKPGDLATLLEKYHQLRGSGITTYVEGNSGARDTGIIIGLDGKPIS